MLCSSWCCLLQTRSDHTWEASRKWLERLQGFGSWSSWISNSWDSNSNFKLKFLRFSFRMRGFQWGAKLARKVWFKWAHKPSIYSQREWYLHTSKSVQNWQCGWHECMGMYRPMMQCKKVQNDSKWSLNGSLIGKAKWTEVLKFDSFQLCSPVKAMRKPSKPCPKWMN